MMAQQERNEYLDKGINGENRLDVAKELQKPNESSSIEPNCSKSSGKKNCAGSNTWKRGKGFAKRKNGYKRKRGNRDVKATAKKPKKNTAESEVDVISCGTTSSDLVFRPVCSISNGDRDISFIHTFNPNGWRDSRDAAVDLFKLFIGPLSFEKFFREYWEKKPAVLHRHKHHYNDGFFSTEALDTILSEQCLEFYADLDIITHVDGVNKRNNPTGRATADIVWKHFKEGCSVHLLNPRNYSKTIRLLISTLQELFRGWMEVNMYLTPAGSQGFPPHYDYVEKFVMQLEGKKRWRLYRPRNDYEVLPRFSSPNFTEADIGDPIVDVVLEAGDLLYFPRGTIHQAETLSDNHSLHITLSTFWKLSWADLLEKLLPAALEVAAAEDRDFRAGLPLDFLDFTGIVYSDINDQRRKAFFEKISLLFKKLCKYAPVDMAVDQMGANCIQNSLPPFLNDREVLNTVENTGLRWRDRGIVEGTEITGTTEIKLLRARAMRLVVEEGGYVLYHSLHDFRLENHPKGIKLSVNEATGVKYLLHSYPSYVRVDTMPIEGSTEEKYTSWVLEADAWRRVRILIKRMCMQPTLQHNSNIYSYESQNS